MWKSILKTEWHVGDKERMSYWLSTNVAMCVNEKNKKKLSIGKEMNMNGEPYLETCHATRRKTLCNTDIGKSNRATRMWKNKHYWKYKRLPLFYHVNLWRNYSCQL